MEDKKNNLEKYGTEAFVPGDGNMNGNGDGAGASTSGNSVGDSVSASGNSPVGRGEGQEGGSGPKVGSEGGLNEKAPETAKNSRRNEKMISEEEAKRLLAEEKVRIEQGWKKSDMKHKRILVTVVIVAAVLCIIGAVFAFMAGENKGNEEAPKRDEVAVTEKGEEEEKEKEPEESKVEEISIEDGVVQRLWKNFNTEKFHFEGMPSYVGIMSSFEPLNKFYTIEGGLSEDKLNDELKFAVALQILDDYRTDNKSLCKGDYEHLRWSDEAGVTHSSTEAEFCIDGGVLRDKVKEIFGGQINLGQFDGKVIIMAGDSWFYSVTNDEVVPVASGATRRLITRVLLKAERDDNHIYLYDMAGYVGCWVAGQGKCEASRLDGVIIPNSENMSFNNMRDYADQFDQFRWTFKKTADGNYVYDKMEKIGS